MEENEKQCEKRYLRSTVDLREVGRPWSGWVSRGAQRGSEVRELKNGGLAAQAREPGV